MALARKYNQEKMICRKLPSLSFSKLYSQMLKALPYGQCTLRDYITYYISITGKDVGPVGPNLMVISHYK
ncbi:Ribosomal protein L40e [Dillenia turbinata]|uniref:Ribosomal protein L40e n=1 Tax=Dillenia turbinata TaxID=194707 RepID=A0AAN8ZQZ3_9MAGN